MDIENQEWLTEETVTDTESVVAAEPLEAPAELEDVTHRLAEDFLALSAEFPQIVGPDQLPDVVLDMAVEQNLSLLDAYLRYRLQEEKKVAAAAEKRQEAARQSAGSLSRGAVQTPPEQDAFLRAFRAAL